MTAPKLITKWLAWVPKLQSVLRIVAAFIFMTSGTMKLFAFPAGIPPNGGTVPLVSQMGLGAILEVFGGALILLGLFSTRPVAFILAGEMAVAYFQFHFPQGFWPTMNGGGAAAIVVKKLRAKNEAKNINPKTQTKGEQNENQNRAKSNP